MSVSRGPVLSSRSLSTSAVQAPLWSPPRASVSSAVTQPGLGSQIEFYPLSSAISQRRHPCLRWRTLPPPLPAACPLGDLRPCPRCTRTQSPPPTSTSPLKLHLLSSATSCLHSDSALLIFNFFFSFSPLWDSKLLTIHFVHTAQFFKTKCFFVPQTAFLVLSV